MNLLTDQIIRVETLDGLHRRLSLPRVYEELLCDNIASFTAQRSHQFHPWRAFLVQLGVLAAEKFGYLPIADSDWESALGSLTSEWPGGEPWNLVVPDLTRPAFFQPPVSGSTWDDYKRTHMAPDEIDVLVTAKRHDIKAGTLAEAEADDWVMALITCQTGAGFRGAGNYGISRMNSGFGSRFGFGLAPAGATWGQRVRRDIDALLDERGWPQSTGHSLLWVRPWDGGAGEALDIADFDPLYIEVCRRLRLIAKSFARLYAVQASSRGPRIKNDGLRGLTGDPWGLVDLRDKAGPKAITVSSNGLASRHVFAYLTSTEEFTKPLLMSPSAADLAAGRGMDLEIAGLVGGQGKTEGYLETRIRLHPKTLTALGDASGESLEDFRAIGKERLEQAALLRQILGHAIQTFLADGDANRVSADTRGLAYKWTDRLSAFIDDDFFLKTQAEFVVSAEHRQSMRIRWLKDAIKRAGELLDMAMTSLPASTAQTIVAEEGARRLFHGRLRSPTAFGAHTELFQSGEEEEMTDAPQFQSPFRK